MRRFVLLLTFASCLPATLAAAQQRDYRAIRDSLARVDDPAALQSMRVMGRGESILHGLAALRLFDLTRQESAAERARDAFELARREDPASAWALWGIGQSLVAMDTVRSEPTFVTGRAFAKALGVDPASKARRAFLAALELEPDFLPAALALAPLAIHAGDADALLVARNTLRRATSSLATGPEAWLALSTVERALGDYDAAANAASLAVAALPGEVTTRVPAAYAHRELAVVRFLGGDAMAGERAWLTAIDAATLESSHRFLEDLQVLIDEYDAETFDHSGLDARREWLRHFWVIRAATAGVTPAERMAEHYRRLEQAAVRFPRQRQYGAPPRNALLLDRPDHPFDDRGLIYIRHGEPFEIIRTPDVTRMQTESWVYRMPDGGFRMLHFANYGSAERSSAAVGDPAATGASGELGDAYDEFLLVYNLPCFGGFAGDRILYDRSLTALMRCDPLEIRSVSASVRREAREALRTDSDAPDFARELPFSYDLHTLRGENGRTDLVAAMVIPGDQIGPVSAPGGVTYGIDVSLVVIDTMFERVTRIDTTLWLRTARPLGPNEWLRAHVTLPVTPSTESIQRLIVRDALDSWHGQLYGRPIALPDYARAGLRISDLILAEPGSGGSWSRDDVTLDFVPTRVFPGGAFRIFFEVYGLPADARYRTEITVDRQGGGIGKAISRLFGGGPAVRLRFDGEAEATQDGIVREIRSVRTALPPGRYDIRIKLTNLDSGETVEQAREFVVTDASGAGSK